MKRLTLRLLKEINYEVSQIVPYYLKSDSTKIIRIVGPNYIYFTNGKLIKVFFDAIGFNGVVFPIPIPTYIGLKFLRNIKVDIRDIKKVLDRPL